MNSKRLVILGSTGSIGTQALDVVRNYGDRFSIFALSGNRNTDLLTRQALEFRPTYVVAGTDESYREMQSNLANTEIVVLAGQEGLCDVVGMDQVDIVLAALVGFAGVRSVLAALAADKTLALANKEALVVAGHLVADALQKGSGAIIPVDSEHSAIFQCLQGEQSATAERIILTASGGSFRDRPLDTFDQITIDDALAHPNWSMGKKITIDSATMMNKGLEVIEAHWLFDMPGDKIDVLMHRQSIVHSMVAFQDGSTMAQLGVPDMKVPIQYALTFPDRWESSNERLNWSQISELTFEKVTHDRYPCLPLAYEAMNVGGSMPAVLNGANEAAVEGFLNGEISFTAISGIIEKAMERHDPILEPTLEALIEADREGRAALEQKYQGTH